jgi:hypothetical protein
MKISENTAVSMPMRNLISIIGAVAVGCWFGFGVIERPKDRSQDLTINFFEDRILKLEDSVEDLKDKVRQNGNH